MIYYVEDNQDIRDLVIYTLNASGMEAKGFSCAREFFAAVEEELPKAVLLDIMLPDVSGLEILEQLRSNANTAELPIIMVTAKDTEFDKVIGLDKGADDYIAKPFGMMEMVARVKALLRRTEKKDENKVFSSGDVYLDTSSHTVTSCGKNIKLTLKEFSLLQLLLENKGKVMTREVLLDKIWGYDYAGETRTLDVHILSLRSKLGDGGHEIKTVRGVGYKIG